MENESIVIEPAVWVDNLFTDEELEKVRDYCDSLSLIDATTMPTIEANTTTPDLSVRKSKVCFIHPNEENFFIFEKIKNGVELANSGNYDFSLFGFQYMQYTVYDGGTDGDFYEYHVDACIGGVHTTKTSLYPRKLSISLVLSDPSEYQGGDFEIMVGKNDIYKVEQVKGRMISFPSFVLHRVTPVTSGQRRSLVVWVLGPQFK
jgi:PKHD-type hydroxylase